MQYALIHSVIVLCLLILILFISRVYPYCSILHIIQTLVHNCASAVYERDNKT